MVLDPLADLAHFEGVPSAVAAATDAVDAVLRDRGLRKITDEQLSQALLAGARANADMTDYPARWQIGAVRLSAELASLAALIRVAPAQALARAHALVARGIVPDSELGKIGSKPAMAARMNSGRPGPLWSDRGRSGACRKRLDLRRCIGCVRGRQRQWGQELAAAMCGRGRSRC